MFDAVELKDLQTRIYMLGRRQRRWKRNFDSIFILGLSGEIFMLPT